MECNEKIKPYRQSSSLPWLCELHWPGTLECSCGGWSRCHPLAGRRQYIRCVWEWAWQCANTIAAGTINNLIIQGNRASVCHTYCHSDGHVGLWDRVHGRGDKGSFHGDLFGERWGQVLDKRHQEDIRHTGTLEKLHHGSVTADESSTSQRLETV